MAVGVRGRAVLVFCLAAWACSCQTVRQRGPDYRPTYEQLEWFRKNSGLEGLSPEACRKLLVLDRRSPAGSVFRAVTELKEADLWFLTYRHPFFDDWRDPRVPDDIWQNTVLVTHGGPTPSVFVPNLNARHWWIYVAAPVDKPRSRRLFFIEFHEPEKPKLYYYFSWF